jgi:hypothetical protein
VIECLYVALSRNELRQNFNVWVYGDEKLVRGSGLFVGETGVEANHHFLTPPDDSSFRFAEGRYTLDVFARLLGDSKQIRLFSEKWKSRGILQRRSRNRTPGCILIGDRTHRDTFRM